MWTVKQTARYLGLKDHQVYYLLMMGEIESVKIGNAWRVLYEAVAAYDKQRPKKQIEALPAILSIRETANFFSVRYLTVYRQIRAGRLPAWKDDEGNWCIARSDIRDFCSKNSNL